MKRVTFLTVAALVVGSMGAAGPGVARDSAGSEVERLRGEAERLRKTNAQLERKLAEQVRENLQLRASAAVTVPVPVPVPEGAIPRGEGNVKHYVFPVEQQVAGGGLTIDPGALTVGRLSVSGGKIEYTISGADHGSTESKAGR